MKMKNIVLLGSTGSVGKSVLEVVRSFPGKFRVTAIASGSNVKELLSQAAEFRPGKVIIGSEDLFGDVKRGVPPGTEVLAGDEGLIEAVSAVHCDIVFMAISGTAALKPLVAALDAGRTVALASKEPVVSAGSIIRAMVDSGKGSILPVDSEHSAVMQCLEGRKVSDVRTLYITGSGGSLRNTEENEFPGLSVEQVLAHPKWDMGRKITVDSATLMNKGLEVIEARWLFDIAPERIKVVIHPEALVHSLVEFVDGTVTASLFCPDMRFPVLRALAHPDIVESALPRVDLVGAGSLTFSEPDMKKFPALALAYDALSRGRTFPAALNAANEKAVGMFLDGGIKFIDIVPTVEKVLERHTPVANPKLQDILDAEKWAKEEVTRNVSRVARHD